MSADARVLRRFGLKDSEIVRITCWSGLVCQALIAIWATRPWLGGDSPVYLQLAQNLGHGCFGVIQASVCQADALRPPGYPLILAGALYGLNLPLVAVPIAQEAIYLLSLRLIDLVLVRRGLSSVPFLLLSLIYPFGAIYSASIMTEAWATLAFSIVAFLICTQHQNARMALVAGLVAGAGALVRSDLLLLPIVCGLLMLLRLWNFGWKHAVLIAILPVLGASIVLLPYVAWNSSHFGKASPAPIASAVGNTLYLAVWQSRLSHDDLDPLYRGVVTPRARASGIVPEIEAINASIGAPALTVPFNPADYADQRLQLLSTKAFGDAAMKHIRSDPAGYLSHVAANVWLLWNTSIYPSGVPAGARLGLRAISAIVFVLGVFGLLIALGSRERTLWSAPAALLLYLPAIHVWLHTEARYTAAARPLLLMFAAVFLSFRLDSRRFTASGATVPANGEKAQDNVRDSWFITRW